MKKLFNDYGIEVNTKQLEMFEKYYQLLVEYNEKFNITAITEREDIYKKHFVDSVLFVNKLKSGNYIDIGSGGGFPALPICILRDDINYTLLEATGKKCEFMKVIINELNLKNAVVINDRAELLAKNVKYREKFDYVTARAVARFNSLCEYCMPFTKVGGSFLAFKGECDEEVNEGLNAVKILGGNIREIIKTTLDDAKRSLIIVEKIKETDKKYPRGNGKERKNPL